MLDLAEHPHCLLCFASRALGAGGQITVLRGRSRKEGHMATSKDVDAMSESEFLAHMTTIMNTTTQNLLRASEGLRGMIAQQEETNAVLAEAVVALGGSPPKPSLRLVGDDA
jgi:hypothetical protein